MGEIFDGLTNYITEWNLRSNTSVLDKHEDYALKQAHELINMAEVFVENNVEVAQILTVQHKSAANLLGDEGKTEMSIPGEMFRMLAKNLPGTRLVDLTDGFSNETEAKDSAADVHLFHSDKKMVAYIASTSEHSSTNSFDFFLSNDLYRCGDYNPDRSCAKAASRCV